MTAWNLHSLPISKDPFASVGFLKKRIETFQNERDLTKAFALHHQIEAESSELESYVHCLLAQNVKDEQAKKLQAELSQLQAAYQSAIDSFDQNLVNLPEEAFQEGDSKDRFILNEKKLRASKRLAPEQEKLIHTLSINGFKSWEELYHDTMGSMMFPLKIEGKLEQFSAAQTHNFLHHPDRSIRSAVFATWEKEFHEKSELFAKILNSIAGFRLSAIQLRNREDFLEEPLDSNRMQRETLEAMWKAVDAKKEVLANFLIKKAKKMGLSRLSWHDIEIASSTTSAPISYEDAQNIIIEQFSRFSPAMGEYARKAFIEKEIEAEDRPDKLPGGFCTPFPLSKASRIFMTWSGTRDNLLTLAHELGHGFHSELMFDQSPLAQKYPMNLAETASTFAEQLIFEGLLANASDETRASILEEKAIRSVLFLMNIRARYLFETEFYERRSKGILSASEISEIMERAQKQAFGNSLELYHPMFWASKQHFYFTHLPFYNFPYTFGYLFSLGLFALANETFAERYAALLKDTGSMTAEDLVKKHLNLDLTQAPFWEKAVQIAIKDAQEYE